MERRWQEGGGGGKLNEYSDLVSVCLIITVMSY